MCFCLKSSIGNHRNHRGVKKMFMVQEHHSGHLREIRESQYLGLVKMQLLTV